MNQKGKNLIFLISQPRAGSTLTQRILGAHTDVHTQSEPWILLLPLHAMKPDNLIAAYNSDLYSKALKNFIGSMPGGQKRYKEDIATVYSGFYETILKHKEKQFFLDKTPRYYHVLNELYDYYPEAKFIFLWRNPAAVICSIINTWTIDNWHRLSEFKDDLLNAPKLMIEGSRNMGDQAFSIYYEDIVQHPLNSITKLCEYIGIPIEDGMMQYNNHNMEKWPYGDQGTVYEKGSPDSDHAEKWTISLNNPQIWKIVNEYISYLGETTLSEMGYSYKQIVGTLQNYKPNIDIGKYSINLSQLLDNTHYSIVEQHRLKEIANQKDGQIRQFQELIRNNLKLIKQKDEELKRKNIDLIKRANEIMQKDNAILEKDNAIFEKEEQLKNISRELIDRDNKLAEREDEIDKKNTELAEKDKKLLEKEGQVKNKSRELIDKNNVLLVKEEDLKHINRELKSKEKKLLEREKELKQIRNKVELLNNKLAFKDIVINEKEEYLMAIINSYSFKIGAALLWPIKKVLNK